MEGNMNTIMIALLVFLIMLLLFLIFYKYIKDEPKYFKVVGIVVCISATIGLILDRLYYLVIRK